MNERSSLEISIPHKSPEEVLVEQNQEKKFYKYILSFGSKTLSLVIRFEPNRQTFICDTFLKNVLPKESKQEGETTTLMESASKKVQEISNTLDAPITLLFHTNSFNLEQWANTTGENMFHWKNSYRKGFRVTHKYEVTFFPQKVNQ